LICNFITVCFPPPDYGGYGNNYDGGYSGGRGGGRGKGTNLSDLHFVHSRAFFVVFGVAAWMMLVLRIELTFHLIIVNCFLVCPFIFASKILPACAVKYVL
jgi:hypothetical protein